MWPSFVAGVLQFVTHDHIRHAHARMLTGGVTDTYTRIMLPRVAVRRRPCGARDSDLVLQKSEPDLHHQI